MMTRERGLRYTESATRWNSVLQSQEKEEIKKLHYKFQIYNEMVNFTNISNTRTRVPGCCKKMNAIKVLLIFWVAIGSEEKNLNWSDGKGSISISPSLCIIHLWEKGRGSTGKSTYAFVDLVRLFIYLFSKCILKKQSVLNGYFKLA